MCCACVKGCAASAAKNVFSVVLVVEKERGGYVVFLSNTYNRLQCLIYTSFLFLSFANLSTLLAGVCRIVGLCFFQER